MNPPVGQHEALVPDPGLVAKYEMNPPVGQHEALVPDPGRIHQARRHPKYAGNILQVLYCNAL